MLYQSLQEFKQWDAEQKIAIAGLASPASSSEVSEAAQVLSEAFGCEVVVDPSAITPLSPKARAIACINLLTRPDIGVVWFARGGEGSADTVPYFVQQMHVLQALRPKVLIGFSDLTAPLSYFAQRLGWPAVHGPAAVQWCENRAHRIDTATQIAMKQLLQVGQSTPITLQPLNGVAHQAREIRGALIGGNLTLLTLSVGDWWELDTAGSILFIEDWHEKPYQVRRGLQYLQRVGMMTHLNALVLGDFMADGAGVRGLDETLSDFAQQLPVPVFHTSQIGHGRVNYPICLGMPGTIRLA